MKDNIDPSLDASSEPLWDLKGEPRDWYYQDYQNFATEAFMFAFAHSGLTTPKLQVRVANSAWSDGIILSGQNSYGMFEVQERDKVKQPKTFVLGLESSKLLDLHSFVLRCCVQAKPRANSGGQNASRYYHTISSSIHSPGCCISTRSVAMKYSPFCQENTCRSTGMGPSSASSGCDWKIRHSRGLAPLT